MIIIDYSGISIAASMEALKEGDTDLSIARHYILNSIQSIRRKLRTKTNGDIVICADAPNPWRRDIFPHYKANRKKARDDSAIDWTAVYQNIYTVFDELKEHFPYKCLKVDKVEADDILATLTKYVTDEDHVVVSNDKDMVQLAMRQNVQVYSTLKAQYLSEENPEKALFFHILKGDTSDGIPNAISDDDTFVVKEKRQSQMRQTKMEMYWSGEMENPIHFERNKKLISLYEIPQEIEDQIMEVYKNTIPKGQRSNLLSYMVSKQLRNLIEKVGEF